MTSVSAIPNVDPIIRGWNGDLAAARGAPRVKIKMMPIPTYAPASSAAKAYLGRLSFILSRLATAASTMFSTLCVNM
ncbi:hypothetical protein D3C76_1775940 [compost metagenome]